MEWLILRCQACGTAMKVRAGELTGRRVACPACRSPVAVQPPEGAAFPEFSAPMARDTDRVGAAPPRSHEDAEFQGTVDFTPAGEPDDAEAPDAQAPEEEDFLQNLRSTADHQPEGRRTRVKKRRRKASAGNPDVLADWDTVLQSVPEAEIWSDPWTESVPIPEEVIEVKSSDFVVSEHEEEGNTVRRVKRVRKRRLFTWAQLFFRRLSLGMRILTITIVAAIALAGVVWGIDIFRQHFQSVTYDDVVSESRLPQEFITSQDESGAAEAVERFLAAVGPEAKLKHVRLPARVKPLMEAYYAATVDRALIPGEIRARDKIRSGSQYFVLLEMEVIDPEKETDSFERSRVKHFAVEESESEGTRTYRVDWETAVEWRPMSFEEFKITRPTYNVPFRIKLRASGYYNHDFADESQWLATEIYFPHPEGVEKIFNGYLERGGPAFRGIAPIVEGGRNPAMIINLRYPSNSVSRDQVIIDSVVLDSWFYSEDVPPGEEKKFSYR
jgi:hypothetical protein